MIGQAEKAAAFCRLSAQTAAALAKETVAVALGGPASGRRRRPAGRQRCHVGHLPVAKPLKRQPTPSKPH